jgi:hypothetical protein
VGVINAYEVSEGLQCASRAGVILLILHLLFGNDPIQLTNFLRNVFLQFTDILDVREPIEALRAAYQTDTEGLRLAGQLSQGNPHDIKGVALDDTSASRRALNVASSASGVGSEWISLGDSGPFSPSSMSLSSIRHSSVAGAENFTGRERPQTEDYEPPGRRERPW